MRHALLKAILGLLIASGAIADAIEPLDGAFLEYLANLEADDSDWTVLATATDDPAPAEPAAAPTAPPERGRPRKPTVETAKPAVEER